MGDIQPRIAILDETTANQIAAGEVVERPSSAVKELVENALDAGAGRVEIDLEEGGKRLIRVVDNGLGMSQEEAILSLQRHATSKIRRAEDLFSINTMGFRGEALPSIGSVSHLTLITRDSAAAEDAAGTEIVSVGGTIESVRDIGSRAGTSITVQDLFYNVPARLKFLKSTATEVSHALELVQRFAIAYPAVAFRLSNNGHELFSAGGGGSALEACVQVYGREIARGLFPIDYGDSSLRISGFIGSPATLRGARSAQHVFVNRRSIRSKTITRALDDAYRSVQTLHGTRYPAAVISVEIDPGQVDVNVSPTKTEVRFTRDGEIFSAVYHGVRAALMAGGLVPSIAAALPAMDGTATPAEPLPMRDLHASLQQSYLTNRSPWGPPPSNPGRQTSFASSMGGGWAPVIEPASAFPAIGQDAGPSSPMPEDFVTAHDAAGPVRSSGPSRDYRRSLDGLRILAQSRNTYIVAQTDHALLLIDQHIAHERVLYEKLIAGAEGGGTGVPVQHLAIPITMELSRREALVVEKRLGELRQAGFELEPFGQDTFLVRAVPASVAQKRLKVQLGPEATLRAIVDEMVEKTVSRRLLLPSEEVLITASCKMAVKAGDPLSMEEMQALITDLLKSENPYTCPHGRPIIVELANGDIDRKFGR